MQKLLATSAIAMIALSGAAFAQDVTDADFTVVDDNTNVTGTPSLLSTILDDAETIQVNMINAAENLANLDGSINVLDSDSVDTLLQELTADAIFGSPVYTWTEDAETGTGTVEVTGTADEYAAAQDAGDVVDLIDVQGGDDFAGLLQGVSQTVDGTTAIDFFDPAATVDALQTDISNLTTTVIGALNTGVIGQNGDTGIAANTLAMANMELESVAQTTGALANSAQYFDPGNLQLANIATNMASVVDASVNVDQ
ncbi:MAG: hypothetical protein N4A39_13795, partial [Roseicyclus sp.]|nr:hypothetical protein [Roseicyclus sp.]